MDIFPHLLACRISGIPSLLCVWCGEWCEWKDMREVMAWASRHDKCIPRHGDES